MDFSSQMGPERGAEALFEKRYNNTYFRLIRIGRGEMRHVSTRRSLAAIVTP
jgi:hypothetical protein